MSDTTTITPEERARLRSAAATAELCCLPRVPRLSPSKIIDILNALEQAEADVARLTKMVDWLASWGDAHPCVLDMACPFGSTYDVCNLARDSAECWKEMARRAVAAGEE